MRLFGHLNVSRLNMSANADAQVIFFPAGIVAEYFRCTDRMLVFGLDFWDGPRGCGGEHSRSYPPRRHRLAHA